ncbi:MAG: ribonuclease PH [Candidatus Omnitrophota bacterium]|jgi:ribonuclease PH
MKRIDKRELNELRKLKLKLGVSRHAEGSCLITAGNTEVLCTASIDESVPRFLKGKGKGWVTAEYAMLPMSCNQRIPRDGSRGKANARSLEIQRLIGRALRSIVDMKALGERTIWLDCDVLQGDGGTRCAAITGAYIALHKACLGLKKKKLIDAWPLRDFVGAVSVGVVEGKPMLDLCYEEDSNADVDMNVIMTGDGRFVEIQGTAEKEPFDEKTMNQLLSLGKLGIKQLIAAQKKVLKIK